MNYIVSIGSNEERERQMALAREWLRGLYPDVRFSEELETEPLFLSRKALFSNQLASFSSACSPDEVVAQLKQIEREAGRTPEMKRQERVPLDLDLLVAGDLILRPKEMERDYIQRLLHSGFGAEE